MGQGGEPEPVGRLVPDSRDIAPEHRVLMPQHQQLRVLRHITADKQHKHGEDLPDDHIQEQEDHHAILPGGPELATEKPSPPAEPSIRASQPQSVAQQRV
jgi:hypothetical protein